MGITGKQEQTSEFSLIKTENAIPQIQSPIHRLDGINSLAYLKVMKFHKKKRI